MKKLVTTLLITTVAIGIAAVTGPARTQKPIAHQADLCCDPPPVCPPICDPPPPGGGQQ